MQVGHKTSDTNNFLTMLSYKKSLKSLALYINFLHLYLFLKIVNIDAFQSYNLYISILLVSFSIRILFDSRSVTV